MKSPAYVALRLLDLKNGQFPDAVWVIGYQAAPNGYAFKPLDGSFNVVKLAAFAATHGLEAHICTLATARSIHGLPV